jgi:hypothetical protein
MATYTIELTPEQDAALDILIPRLNADLPKEATPHTKASYIQERASGVADSYVEQVSAMEASAIADAYKLATDAEKGSVKSTLKVAQ